MCAQKTLVVYFKYVRKKLKLKIIKHTNTKYSRSFEERCFCVMLEH